MVINEQQRPSQLEDPGHMTAETEKTFHQNIGQKEIEEHDL